MVKLLQTSSLSDKSMVHYSHNDTEESSSLVKNYAFKLKIFKVSHLYSKADLKAEKEQQKKFYKCPYCNYVYKNVSRYEVHLRTHTGDKPFICPHCSKKFNEKGTMKTHIRIHTGERPFKCRTCCKSFKTKGNLIDHENTHLKIKPFICPICKKSFNRKSRLKIHNFIHLKLKLFQCNLCQRQFREKNNLYVHLKVHLPNYSSLSKKELENYVKMTKEYMEYKSKKIQEDNEDTKDILEKNSNSINLNVRMSPMKEVNEDSKEDVEVTQEDNSLKALIQNDFLLENENEKYQKESSQMNLDDELSFLNINDFNKNRLLNYNKIQDNSLLSNDHIYNIEEN